MKAPPRRTFAPALGDHFRSFKELLARFDGAGPRHDYDFFAANLNTVGEFDDGVMGMELTTYEFVGSADAVHFFDAGEDLEVASVEVNAPAHGGQHRLPRTGGAMHREAHSHEVVGNVLDLVFGGGF